MEKIQRCVLTGFVLDKTVVFDNSNPLVIDYKFSPVGRARIAETTYYDLFNKGQFTNHILAGICRNAFENDQEPPLINADFISREVKNYKYPTEFKEKASFLLRHLYHKGGKDYKHFNLTSTIAYPICYSNGYEEFERIMTYLEDKCFIKWVDKQQFGYVSKYYKAQLTDSGIEEVEKELPKIPLIGLVTQKITTGDFEIDLKIDHAQDLFFSEPQSIDKMRSACETLSYLLEPMRSDLGNYFLSKDVSDFFQLVNTFDIRHNKEQTKKLEHEEQLEWIYYTLLNTINTYTKLKRRLG